MMKELVHFKKVVTVTVILTFILAMFLGGCGGSSTLVAPDVQTSSTAWSFGVMSDTQWISPADGKNPNAVAVDIIRQLNQQFIQKGVKFVVQVGDLTQNGNVADVDTTALFRQPLYNAGIGFFPLRGNHESKSTAAVEFQRVFPQTQTGQMNATPADVFTNAAVNPDAATQPSPVKTGTAFTVGSHFSSPDPSGNGNLKGLSYSFDFNNARFVLLDQFTPTDNDTVNYALDKTIAKQQSWISSTLSGKPASGHAFVFSHKGLITENHTDTLFGNDPSQNPDAQNAFIGSMAQNGARYLMMGHDHMHQRSVVTSPDGKSQVQNVTCASDSSKFYIPLGNAELPGTVNNDMKYNNPTRETSISQERNTVGYYIVTVDGPRVTVDYYSAVVNATFDTAKGEYTITTTPTMTFTKRETYGYSLNGKETLVAEGRPYATVQDTFSGTTAKILSGNNNSTTLDGSGRALTNAVDTGWSATTTGTNSNILTLWGITKTMGSTQTDTYTLSMSYDPSQVSAIHAQSGAIGLATPGINGKWVNAVSRNTGGTSKFVFGPWQSSYGLGTYGVDTATNTAWAVINYNGNFVVAPGI
ncbi:MAG: metallophosphoesterase [Thermodesulfovibrionales bacterium]